MFSIPAHAQIVVDRLERYGYEAYVVGGCVRDSLLGRTPKDWDVCTNALPDEVLRVFRRFHVIKTGLKHGTVTVMVNHEPVEVTTYRIDGEYTDNRHPDAVQFVSEIEADLARRDFTINAMAYSPTRGLVDAFGGQEDLAAKQIRCVGEPDERFNEDGLRLMRALRFAARYNFDIERETAYSIHRNRHLLENVSAERIFSELKGICLLSPMCSPSSSQSWHLLLVLTSATPTTATMCGRTRPTRCRRLRQMRPCAWPCSCTISPSPLASAQMRAARAISTTTPSSVPVWRVIS